MTVFGKDAIHIIIILDIKNRGIITYSKIRMACKFVLQNKKISKLHNLVSILFV